MNRKTHRQNRDTPKEKIQSILLIKMVKNLPNCRSVCKAVSYTTTHKVTSNGTIATKNVQGSISLNVLRPLLIFRTSRQTFMPLKACQMLGIGLKPFIVRQRSLYRAVSHAHPYLPVTPRANPGHLDWVDLSRDTDLRRDTSCRANHFMKLTAGLSMK